jgi:hypothetical protein
MPFSVFSLQNLNVEATKAAIFARCLRSESGCLEWQAATSGSGYGVLKVCGKQLYAHRVSHELNNAPLTDDKPYVIHSCDNPRCVNPAHLSAGTLADNQRDSISKGRKHGSTHAQSAEFAARAAALRAAGLTQEAIARSLGSSQQRVCKALKRHGKAA